MTRRLTARRLIAWMPPPPDWPSDTLIDPSLVFRTDVTDPINILDVISVLAVVYGLDPDQLLAAAIARQGQIPCVGVHGFTDEPTEPAGPCSVCRAAL